MKTYEELAEEIERDSDIDRMNLELEIGRTPRLMSKYLRMNYEYKSAMVKGESKLAQLVLERRDFYNGEAESHVYRAEPWNGIVKNAEHLKMLLNADDKVNKYREMVDNAKLLVEMCEEMIMTLRYRNNHVSTILDIRKFESGS